MEALDAAWSEYQRLFPGKATDYMAQLMAERHRWVRAYRLRTFTMGFSGNTMAEVMNSNLSHWLKSDLTFKVCNDFILFLGFICHS